MGEGARGRAGQAGSGRGSGERPGERRPDRPPAPRPSVRAGPLNAAGGGCGLHALPASRRREPRPLAPVSPRPARSQLRLAPPRPAPLALGSPPFPPSPIFPYPAQPGAGPRPSRAPAAAKRGCFCDAVTAKWCDRGSCRRGRCAPHRELRGGSRRRPEGAAEGTESGGRRRAARGSRAEGPRSPPLSMSRAA